MAEPRQEPVVIEEMRSDERILRRARAALAMTVEERLAEAIALCRAGAAMLAALPEDVRERARAYREKPADGAEEALRRLLIGP